MKILKVDHIGIAVNSIDAGKSLWTDALGLAYEGSETVEEQKVTTAFFPVGESEVELLESTAPDGPVAKFLDKKGEGIHHIAFDVVAITTEAYQYYKSFAKQIVSQTVSLSEPVISYSNFENGLGLFTGYASTTNVIDLY